MKNPYVYMLASGWNGTLYVGKAIKAWKREWKVQLIEAANPSWRDLYSDLVKS